MVKIQAADWEQAKSKVEQVQTDHMQQAIKQRMQDNMYRNNQAKTVNRGMA